jgi:UMP-CMP kinase
MKVFFILGPPGSGKGTQCALLMKRMNILHISAGELLRNEQEKNSADSELIKTYLNKGTIVPIEITCRLLLNEMRRKPTPYYLIDGFPRNEDNFSGWFRETEGIADVKGTIVLNTDRNSVLERLRQRGRFDDNIETIEKRFDIFYKKTLPIISKLNDKAPLLEINANTTNIQEINDQLYRKLKFLL